MARTRPEARARLKAYMERHGLKTSRRRDAIVDAFLAVAGHVSVDELLAAARERDARVSPATVYRAIKLLVDAGVAVARQFGDGQTRYEPVDPAAHHDHLICTDCGAIVEFVDDRIEELQDQVAARHGFEVTRHRLELYGRCARCAAT